MSGLHGVKLELDNYRAALEWALVQENDAVPGGAIAGALERFWSPARLAVEGRYWIELALPRVSQAEQPRIAARLQLALSHFRGGMRGYDAAERAMLLYESVGDPCGAAHAQKRRGFALFQMGRLDEAREAIAQGTCGVARVRVHAQRGKWP